jgi:hypothetical protein
MDVLSGSVSAANKLVDPHSVKMEASVTFPKGNTVVIIHPSNLLQQDW